MERYRNAVADSARWSGFAFRKGDVLVCAPVKSGTTWMQALCAMLVLGTTEFDRPLSELSPWLDMLTSGLAEVTARLEAQRHRRVVKTHTPLDGLPFDPRATYVVVGRDPRDAAVSFQHHRANIDLGALVTACTAAAARDGRVAAAPPERPPADPAQRFRQWLDGEDPSDYATLPSMLHHLATFWARRDEPNIAFFHYDDLLSDLPGQVRRLADVLAVTMPGDRLDAIAAAATFDRMQERADVFAPEVGHRLWRDNAGFFHRGRSGQWRDWLDADSVRRYESRVAELVPADLAAWLHATRS